METYKDLIEKAQNLTLQRDRLQASQVLIRGIQKESKNSQAYKELTRALTALASLFYSEKAHGLYFSAQSMAATKPKEAVEIFNEALRLEDSNLSLLLGAARSQLELLDCSKADSVTAQAEGIDPYSPEVKLLRLQVLECQKAFVAMGELLSNENVELEPLQKFTRGLEIESAQHDGTDEASFDAKKVKALLAAWEMKDPDYPELYYWRWKYYQSLANELDPQLKIKSTPSPEGSSHSAALKYLQLCQNLSARKRRSFELDVKLCRGNDEVDLFLKSSGQTPSPVPNASASPAKGSVK